MPMSEADTRANLIDPVLHDRGWVWLYLKREESGKAVDIVNGRPRQCSTVYVEYTLRVEANVETQPVAVALIEAKAEDLPPDHGLEQAKAYARCKRFNVPFNYASNGHQFVEFDRYTGLTSRPCPMARFPSRAELRARYEQTMGARAVPSPIYSARRNAPALPPVALREGALRNEAVRGECAR